MSITKSYWISFISAVLLVAADFIFFRQEGLFPFLLGVSFLIVALPFFLSLLSESKVEREKSERFLEFTRNLAESVKAGTPIGKSIINMSNKDYGMLTPHIKKLANQIALGIPVGKAFETFSNDVNNVVVRRAITLIREAESAGGEIDYILDSTAGSIYQIEKLKKERRAAVSSLVVQGYIIFLIFVGIMLVMQFKILPLTANVGSLGSLQGVEGASGSAETSSPEKLARPFLYLLLVQGFFSGLTIGKISEGSIRAGLKHSIVLVLAAFLITSGATAFLHPGVVG